MAKQTIRVTRTVTRTKTKTKAPTTTALTSKKPGNPHRCSECGKYTASTKV